MYKHAMLKKLRDYSTIREMQPALENQIAGAKWKLEKDGDKEAANGEKRSRSIDRMEKVYRANAEFLADMECCLAVLDDREMKIIHHFYVERTWDYIEILNEELGIERSQIYRIKDRAMKKLSLAYFGV